MDHCLSDAYPGEPHWSDIKPRLSHCCLFYDSLEEDMKSLLV